LAAALATCAAGFGGHWLGAGTAREGAPVATRSAPPEVGMAAGAPRRARPGQVPAFAGPPAEAAAHEAERRRAGAKGVVQALFETLRSSPGHGRGTPEYAAAHTREFIRGVAQTAKAIAPELLVPLADEVTDRLCDPAGQGDDELVMLAFVQQEMPELSSARGFECVLARRRGTEDIVTWSMLDAWRQSGLPRTPSIEALARDARDERTRSRFLAPADELALRSRRAPAGAR
jgi:hypothetical protein